MVTTSSQLLVIGFRASTRMPLDVSPRSRPIPREGNSKTTLWLTIQGLVANHLSLMVFLQSASTLHSIALYLLEAHIRRLPLLSVLVGHHSRVDLTHG